MLRQAEHERSIKCGAHASCPPREAVSQLFMRRDTYLLFDSRILEKYFKVSIRLNI